MSRVLKRAFSFLTFAVAYTCALSAMLWWFYGLGREVSGGHYSFNEAFFLAIKMGLLITCVATVVWVLALWRGKPTSIWELAWIVAGGTAFSLSLYLSVVMFRREHWDPSQGVNDYAMFLPIVGRVNGAFMAEYRWLIFLIGIIPCASIFSAAFFALQERIARASSGGNRS